MNLEFFKRRTVQVNLAKRLYIYLAVLFIDNLINRFSSVLWFLLQFGFAFSICFFSKLFSLTLCLLPFTAFTLRLMPFNIKNFPQKLSSKRANSLYMWQLCDFTNGKAKNGATFFKKETNCLITHTKWRRTDLPNPQYCHIVIASAAWQSHF